MDKTDSMLIAIRRVIRAVDVHSRQLARSHQLTGPQALVINETIAAGELTSSDLAKKFSLSQATISDIVKRLESRGLLQRTKDTVDKRRVVIRATEAGIKLNESAPPLLQETFSTRFDALKEWEQHMLLGSIQRIAELMDAKDLDAAPLLSSGPPCATPEAIEQVMTDEDQPVS